MIVIIGLLVAILLGIPTPVIGIGIVGLIVWYINKRDQTIEIKKEEEGV